MSTGRRVLIVGSYPPIPLPAAAATLSAVRQAWADGDEVTVVSPRLSAAHLSVAVAGVLAGRRLGNLRRHTDASRAVLVVERGVPIPATSGRGLAVRLAQWQTMRGIVQAFRDFDHVTLLRVGTLDVPGRIEAGLLRAASEVLDFGPEPGVADASELGAGPGQVTALGPVETLPRERLRQIAGMTVRRVLGRRAAGFRARAAAVVRSVRPARGT